MTSAEAYPWRSTPSTHFFADENETGAPSVAKRSYSHSQSWSSNTGANNADANAGRSWSTSYHTGANNADVKDAGQSWSSSFFHTGANNADAGHGGQSWKTSYHTGANTADAGHGGQSWSTSYYHTGANQADRRTDAEIKEEYAKLKDAGMPLESMKLVLNEDLSALNEDAAEVLELNERLTKYAVYVSQLEKSNKELGAQVEVTMAALAEAKRQELAKKEAFNEERAVLMGKVAASELKAADLAQELAAGKAQVERAKDDRDKEVARRQQLEKTDVAKDDALQQLRYELESNGLPVPPHLTDKALNSTGKRTAFTDLYGKPAERMLDAAVANADSARIALRVAALQDKGLEPPVDDQVMDEMLLQHPEDHAPVQRSIRTIGLGALISKRVSPGAAITDPIRMEELLRANLTPTEHTALEATCRAREVHMLAECGVKAALLEPDNGERLRLALATDDLKQLYESDDALRRERLKELKGVDLPASATPDEIDSAIATHLSPEQIEALEGAIATGHCNALAAVGVVPALDLPTHQQMLLTHLGPGGTGARRPYTNQGFALPSVSRQPSLSRTQSSVSTLTREESLDSGVVPGGLILGSDGRPVPGEDGQPLYASRDHIGLGGVLIDANGAPLLAVATGKPVQVDARGVSADGVLLDAAGRHILGSDGKPIFADPQGVGTSSIIVNADGMPVLGDDGEPLHADPRSVSEFGVVVDASGKPLLDADGNPMFAEPQTVDERGAILDEAGEPVTDSEGTPMFADPMHVTKSSAIFDQKGNQVLGSDGEPMFADPRTVSRSGVIVDLYKKRPVPADDGRPLFASGGSVGPGGAILDGDGEPILGRDGKRMYAFGSSIGPGGVLVGADGSAVRGPDGRRMYQSGCSVAKDGGVLSPSGSPLLDADRLILMSSGHSVGLNGVLLGSDGDPLTSQPGGKHSYASGGRIGPDGLVLDRAGNALVGPDGRPLVAGSWRVAGKTARTVAPASLARGGRSASAFARAGSSSTEGDAAFETFEFSGDGKVIGPGDDRWEYAVSGGGGGGAGEVRVGASPALVELADASVIDKTDMLLRKDVHVPVDDEKLDEICRYALSPEEYEVTVGKQRYEKMAVLASRGKQVPVDEAQLNYYINNRAHLSPAELAALRAAEHEASYNAARAAMRLEKLLEKRVAVSDELVIGCQRGDPYAVAQLDELVRANLTNEEMESVLSAEEVVMPMIFEDGHDPSGYDASSYEISGGHDAVLDKLPASGLTWRKTKYLGNSTQLKNAALSEALQEKLVFSVDEWEAFGITELRMDHYVEAGDTNYEPAYIDSSRGGPRVTRQASGTTLPRPRSLRGLATERAAVGAHRGDATEAALEQQSRLLEVQGKMEAEYLARLAASSAALRETLQGDLDAEAQARKEAQARNLALLDAVENQRNRNAELTAKIGEHEARELDRLRQLESVNSSRETELRAFRLQAERAIQDAAEAKASREQLERAISQYSKILDAIGIKREIGLSTTLGPTTTTRPITSAMAAGRSNDPAERARAAAYGTGPTIDDAMFSYGGGGGGSSTKVQNFGSIGPGYHISISSSTPPHLLQLDKFVLLTDEGTVGYLKRQITNQLHISPRLGLSVNASSSTLPLNDDALIAPYSDHGKGAERLLISAAPRPLSDFFPGSPALPAFTQVRIRPLVRGMPQNFCVTASGLSEATTVRSLQHSLVSVPSLLPIVEGKEPEELELYFSPVFITPDVLLNRKGKQVLKPEQTLGEVQLVDDDIVYLVVDETVGGSTA